MKAQEDLDLIFQQRLQNMEVVPPAFVWPAVENELRKRRRRFAFWLFFGCMIGVGLLATTWMWQHHTSAKTVVLTPSTHAAPPETAPHNAQAISGRSDETGNKEVNLQENSGITRDGISPSSTSSENNPNSLTALPIENNPTPSDKPTANTPKTTSSIAETKKNETSAQSGRTAKGVDSQVIKGYNAPLKKPGVSPAVVKPEPESIAQPNNTVLPAVPQSTVEQVNNTPVATQRSFNVPATVQALERTPLLSMSLRPLVVFDHKLPSMPAVKRQPVLTTIRKKKEPKNCYDFEKHRTVLLIDAFLGPSFARKSLRSDDPENADYLAQRRSTERSEWASNAGVRGTLVFDRHFMLRAGLQYDHIGEVFEFIDPDYVQYDIRVTVLNGQEYRETLGIEFGEHYLRTYNRLDMLDIPLQVGAELRSGRTGLSINAGASVNVLFWKRGAMLTPQGEPAYFTPGDGMIDAFRTRVGLSAVASVQCFYHLKPRLRIFAEPYFRQILRPVSLANQPVEQRYSIWGVKLGVTKIVD